MPKKQTPEKAEEKKKAEKISEQEYEKKVIEFAKDGLTSEKIGESLRKEGIHPKEYGKKISAILKEKKIYVVPEIKNIEEKMKKIKKHYEHNKQDKKAMREKDRVFSQQRRLQKYFGS